MRLTKLFAAAGLVTALAVPGPAGARTPLRAGHAGVGGCHVTVNAAPYLITTGENATVFGALICPGTGGSAVVGQTVTIYAHTARIPGLRVVGTATTGAGGAYVLTVNGITADTTYYASAVGARSHTRIIRVAPLVTFKAVSFAEGATITTGVRNTVAFTGTVLPGDNGAAVLLQRENKTADEEWIGIARGRVHGTNYTILHHFIFPGDANLRVIVLPHGAFKARGISNVLSFEISQKQNPNLEIHTSSYSVPYGSTVTISGVLKSGGTQKVTLFGRPRGVPGPATKVAETTTAGGSYSFTISPATANTAYYVTGGGFRSAILFQGVKYAINANAPTVGSVSAGTSLTLTGTVTPAYPGKDVYLERENAGGGGFHVVDAAPVKPLSNSEPAKGGSYELTWWFYGAGKQTYRVRVPGDPSNQSAAGAPFSVEVTPATGPLTPGFKQTLPH